MGGRLKVLVGECGSGEGVFRSAVDLFEVPTQPRVLLSEVVVLPPERVVLLLDGFVFVPQQSVLALEVFLLQRQLSLSLLVGSLRVLVVQSHVEVRTALATSTASVQNTIRAGLSTCIRSTE
jgi:hypothetical protein